MSHTTGFPEHASGNKTQPDFGVQVKPSYQYVPAKEGLSNDFYPSKNEQDNKKIADARIEADTFSKTGEKPVVCCSRVCICNRKWWASCALVCIFFTLLFFCVCGYSIHKYSSDVEDLRQEVKQLARLCQFGRESSGNSASDVGNADDFARRLQSDVYAPSQVPSSPGRISPGDAGYRESEDGIFTYKNQADQRWLKKNPNKDIDDEDEDDDGDDDDDDSSNVLVEKENAAVGKLLRRKRRVSGAATAKPAKKRKNKRRKSNKRRRDNCKRYRRCINKNGDSGLRKSLAITAPPFLPKAVHFFSDFWNGSRQLSFGKETPLKFLQAADWMSKVYPDKSQQPLQATNDGGFLVRESGLYLIYSSVMFHDLKPRHSHAVVVDGDKVFKCMDSVDYVDLEMPSEDKQAKYKSCTVTGVTHLTRGSRLEVQNLYDNTEIDLSTDATYFGAILFSPGVVKMGGGGNS